MEQAKRDANNVTSMLGTVSSETKNIKIENATGYLRLSAALGANGAPAIVHTEAQRDANDVPSLLGTFNGEVRCLLVEHSTGRLRVKGTPYV